MCYDYTGATPVYNYGIKPCAYFYPYMFDSATAGQPGQPDPCFKPPDNTDITYPVFFYGLVGRGLLPALRQFVLLSRALLKERVEALASLGAGAELPRVDLNKAPTPLSFVDRLGRMYLPAGLDALSVGRVNEDTAYLAQFADLNLAATLLCVLALVLFYALAYRPLFAHLDRDIKNTRGLLLLLPEKAARAVPAVSATGKRLLGVQ